MGIEAYTTKQLVDELMERDGVDTELVYPNEDMKITVNGPAIVLVVYD